MRFLHPAAPGRWALPAPRLAPPALDAATLSPACPELPADALSRLLLAARGVATLFVATEHGFYDYDPSEHALVTRTDLDVRRALRLASAGPEAVSRAPAVFVIAPGPGRSGSREVEGAARDLLAAAEALGLRGRETAALDATRVSDALGLPPGCEPARIVTVARER